MSLSGCFEPLSPLIWPQTCLCSGRLTKPGLALPLSVLKVYFWSFPSVWIPHFSPKGLPWYLVGGGSRWARSETGFFTSGLVQAFTVDLSPLGPRGLTAVPLVCHRCTRAC